MSVIALPSTPASAYPRHVGHSTPSSPALCRGPIAIPVFMAQPVTAIGPRHKAGDDGGGSCLVPRHGGEKPALHGFTLADQASRGWRAFARHDSGNDRPARPGRSGSATQSTTAPIIIAAGGTGGHFFPAEALAAELIARGHRVVLMTDARSGGLRSTVFADQERFVLAGAGIAGRGPIRAARAVLSLGQGILQARRIMRDLHPAVVVGFGGYPAVAPVLAARLSHPRPSIILHEQNGVLGRANRQLCRWASRLALSLTGTANIPTGTATELTGNPVRPAVQALAQAGYAAPGRLIHLLILGGSLGARVFSDIVPAALTALPESMRSRLRVVQQCRTEDLERVRGVYEQAGIRADLAPFFPDVADRLVQAHLVIARAGASTVAELAVAGRPAILVPLPGAIDDHQTANARSLAETGGAWLIPQAAFTADSLTERLTALLDDPAALATAATAIRAAARPDAAARLADLVEAHMHQEARS